MKKAAAYFLAFAVFMFLLQVVSAETQVFSGKVRTDKDFLVDGKNFKLIYDGDSNQVFVQNPAQNLIIINGACKQNDFFRVCINSANFSDRNLTTYISYYDVDLTVYKMTASPSTQSRVNLSTLIPHESTGLIVTITNPTNYDITNLTYSEDLSPFIVKEIQGCTLDGTKMIWQGLLKSDYSKTCTATISGEKEGTYNLAGTISFFNSYETLNNATAPIAITVLPRQLKMIHLADQEVKAEQQFYVNTSLQNLNDVERIDVNAVIQVPSNIAFISTAGNLRYNYGFSKDGNTLKKSFSLQPGEYFNYSVYFKELSEGENPIKETFDYIIKSISDKLENDTFVSTPNTQPTIKLNSESDELLPGQKFNVNATIRNPSKLYQLTNIKANLSAPYNQAIVQNLTRLVPNDVYTINSTFTLPSPPVPLPEKISIRLNLKYNFNEIPNSLDKYLELKISKSLNGSNLTNEIIENITQSAKQGVNELATQNNRTNANLTASQGSNSTSQETTTTEVFYEKSNILSWILISISIFIFFIVSTVIAVLLQIKKGTQVSKNEKIAISVPQSSVRAIGKKQYQLKILTFMLILLMSAGIIVGYKVLSQKSATSQKAVTGISEAQANNETGTNIPPESKLGITGKLAFGFVIVVIILVTLILVNKIGKGKEGSGESEEGAALRELQEKL